MLEFSLEEYSVSEQPFDEYPVKVCFGEEFRMVEYSVEDLIGEFSVHHPAMEVEISHQWL